MAAKGRRSTRPAQFNQEQLTKPTGIYVPGDAAVPPERTQAPPEDLIEALVQIVGELCAVPRVTESDGANEVS